MFKKIGILTKKAETLPPSFWTKLIDSSKDALISGAKAGIVAILGTFGIFIAE